MVGGIYAITGGRGGDPCLIAASIHLAWKGGADAVQIREKSASQDWLRQLGSFLIGPRSGKLIINGDIMARWPWDLLKPDGLHFGVANARNLQMWPARSRHMGGGQQVPWIWSAHSAVEAAEAFDRGASAVTVSPIYETESHPGSSAGGLGLLRQTVSACGDRPVIALGGIRLGRLAECRQIGAAGVAMIGAVFGTPDPETSVRQLCEEWNAAVGLRPSS